jgi:hypothetical protein
MQAINPQFLSFIVVSFRKSLQRYDKDLNCVHFWSIFFSPPVMADLTAVTEPAEAPATVAGLLSLPKQPKHPRRPREGTTRIEQDYRIPYPYIFLRVTQPFGNE